ncbi:hypothetical protein Q0Z83_044920 [Actinoplanes sichuanensis]|uniref:SIR2-like domain-containing protein n=1 Tax=Actinoplanes sichuanensis TaxID=512349 RepID=A0ABW4AR97_9ACTN|nr:hypothetical protein [Actinoplanes sichuanensis]BEL06301.1 hypothetical protein Q0Z83_044920 [Actinoplanes sichuanensis]
MTEQVRPLQDAEEDLIKQLVARYGMGQRITLVVGSGLGDPAAPRLVDVIRLAEQYARGRDDDGDLTEALHRVRESTGEGGPAALYEGYRRVLADWISADEFDAIAQLSVLKRYRPPELIASPLGSHGFWQPITMLLGEEIEEDHDSWQLSGSIRALGALLAERPELFGARVLTTNIDPALEIAIRRAGGTAVSKVANRTGIPYPQTSDRVVAVHHLHGFWRPLPQSDPGRLTEHIDESAVTRIARHAAPLIEGDLVCVLGSSDRGATIKAALAETRRRNLPVLWASHEPDAPDPEIVGLSSVRHLRPVDNARLFPELAEAFSVRVPSGPTETVKARHPNWERIFVSQPDSEPPEPIDDLLRELERRFGWKSGRPKDAPPIGASPLVYWPVRLRRPSVIHMAQAFAVGALAGRGARIVVALDDLSVADSAALRGPFEAELRRWITHVTPDPDLTFQSLRAYVENRDRMRGPEDMLRPTDPWVVAREFYGRPVSLYTALAAVKALPHLSPFDLDIEESAAMIVQNLQQQGARRILTPMTIWAYLHSLLRKSPDASVITISGRDEGLFWDQWHQIFRHRLSPLYNPRIKSVSHESGMVRWSSAEQLARQLQTVPRSHEEGRYLHWLFQNAVLLPAYLTRRRIPEVDGFAIDSWAAFAAAMEADLPVLNRLADWATERYLGPN